MLFKIRKDQNYIFHSFDPKFASTRIIWKNCREKRGWVPATDTISVMQDIREEGPSVFDFKDTTGI